MSKLAYGAYYYDASGKGGKFGVASYADSAVKSEKSITTTSADPKVFFFKSPDGEKRVLTFETVWENKVAKAGSIQVYNENMQSNKTKLTTTGLVNLSAISEVVNGKLYAIDYDNAKVVRFSVAYDGTLSLDKEAYTDFTATQSDAKAYGVDVITDGTNVYALFISAVNLFPGNYKSYSIVKLDMNLKKVAQHNEIGGMNAFSIQLYNSDIYVLLVGGGQHYGITNGTNSKIQKISTSNFSAAATTLLVGGNSYDLGDFRALTFTAAGDAYILTGRYDNAGATFSGALHHTTVTKLLRAGGKTIADIESSKYLLTSIKGYLWDVFFAATDKVLWVAQGNDVAVYSYKGNAFTLSASANITTLAGSDYSLNSAAVLDAAAVLKGYVAPEFASISAEARLAKEALLQK